MLGRQGLIAVALLAAAATAPGTSALVTGASAGHQQLRSLKPRLSSSAAVPRLSSAGGGRGGGIRLRGGGGGGGGGDDSNPVFRYWAKYLDLLDKEPLATRVWTGFIIGIFGDVLSQTMAGAAFSQLDIKRLLIFASWGGFCFTPIAMTWYGIIEATIPAKMAMRGAAKMAMDQILFPPAVTAFTFFCLTIIEGLFASVSLTVDKGFSFGGKTESLTALAKKGIDKVKRDLGATLITNYKVLFVNVVAVWWNFVLSMTQHK